jgi:FMN phosphatase YigB (HAD superfamily)
MAGMAFRAVLFDWRGTLVTTLTEEEWVREALRRAGLPAADGTVTELAARLRHSEPELDAPGTDTDAGLHRETYLRVLRGLGLEEDLVAALYAVECDPACNVFADDVPETLARLRAAGVRIGIVSDVHVDIRPAFAAAGLDGAVDVFTLSFEQGVQKPDRLMFTRTLASLGVAARDALVVGDRSGPDGGAVGHDLVTLLLPTLAGPGDRRLHHVARLCL